MSSLSLPNADDNGWHDSYEEGQSTKATRGLPSDVDVEPNDLSDCSDTTDRWDLESQTSSRGDFSYDASITAVDVYKWTVSPLGVSEIRLITIEPSQPGKDDTDVVRCWFRKTSVESPSDYIAISYHWGPTSVDGSHLTETILLEGLVLRVSTTLYSALKRLRTSGKGSRAFWIDALCINQADLFERSQQVMMMDKIYRSATELIIWMGEMEEPDLHRGTPTIISKGEVVSLRHLGSGVDFTATTKLHSERQTLLLRPWFTRRWVIQEVHCCVGSHSILIGPYCIPVTNIQSAVGSPLRTRTPHDGRKSHSLLFNLVQFAGAQCLDDRDRLYALRALSKDGENLIVDYTKNTETVYLDFAKRLIEAGRIFLIAMCTVLEGDNKLAEPRTVPSWCPDWKALRNFQWAWAPWPWREYESTMLSYMDQAMLPSRHQPPLHWGWHASGMFAKSVDGNECVNLRGWMLSSCGCPQAWARAEDETMREFDFMLAVSEDVLRLIETRYLDAEGRRGFKLVSHFSTHGRWNSGYREYGSCHCFHCKTVAASLKQGASVTISLL